jgi:hypothetical protein
VTGAAAGAAVTLVERRLELGQVTGSERVQAVAGLDQHPGGPEAARPVRRFGREPELARGGRKALQVRLQRARGHLAPERQKRAGQQVVIAGP